MSLHIHLVPLATSVGLCRLPRSAEGNARSALSSPDSEDGVVLLDRGQEHLSPLILGLMEVGFIRECDQYARAIPQSEQFTEAMHTCMAVLPSNRLAMTVQST
jgi:hypothetical protein